MTKQTEHKRQKKLQKRKEKAAQRREHHAVEAARKAVRRCGDCKLCCYVFALAEFAKPRRVWCKHACENGCAIYEQHRPPVCTDFKCLWLLSPGIPDRYRPDKIGCVFWPKGFYLIHATQSFDGAANRHDAKELIDQLTGCGYRLVIFWTDETGRAIPSRVYDARRYPMPPSWDELLPVASDEERESVRRLRHFQDSGQSDCLWDGAREADAGNMGLSA